MSGRDRVAAVKRARERQARIEEALARVTKAQRRAEQAWAQRQRSLEAAEAKVASAEDRVACDIAALATICGSTAYVAEVLGFSERQVSRLISRGRKQAEATGPEPERRGVDR